MAGMNDEGIMLTNNDASTCKRSAVAAGYYEDPFIEHFSRGHHLERKPPEINRGYYARVFAVEHLLLKFLDAVKDHGAKCQVVNLGCGFDTLFWRLKSLHSELSNCIQSFVDLDLFGITSRKVMAIRRKPQLLSVLGDDIQFSPSELHSSVYHLVAADIRSPLDPPINDDSVSSPGHHTKISVRNKLMNECHLDKNLPTIFIAECVLVYMDSCHSKSILSWITSTFTTCSFINYEQVNLDDRFGQIMIENLRQREADLLGLDTCKDLASQEERMVANGFESAVALNMDTIYKENLPINEKERIEKLEFLDETDLLFQLLTHYSIVYAEKGLRKFLGIVGNNDEKSPLIGF